MFGIVYLILNTRLPEMPIQYSLVTGAQISVNMFSQPSLKSLDFSKHVGFGFVTFGFERYTLEAMQIYFWYGHHFSHLRINNSLFNPY